MSSAATAATSAVVTPAEPARRPRRRPAPPTFAVGVLGLIVLAGILAPLVAPHDAEAPSLAVRALPPASTAEGGFYLLGTDALGRDLLSRVIFGARVSLVVGICSMAIGGTLGTLLGLLAGFYGRKVDAIITRLADLQLSIPFLILAISIMSVLGAGLSKVILVLGLTSWIMYARVVRGEVLAVRGRDYVLAARALGASDGLLLRRHILPNVSTSAIVIGTFEIARAILSEASLSFLGLGVQPPTPSWGGMVADGREYLTTAWWIATWPGVFIAITVMSINLMGDWLRDVLDPVSRGRGG
ncbi:MAG: ABC transporter permease [Chloroflexi bacterium]|nr:ABC transporter permease [Chloroflexota bacterium]